MRMIVIMAVAAGVSMPQVHRMVVVAVVSMPQVHRMVVVAVVSMPSNNSLWALTSRNNHLMRRLRTPCVPRTWPPGGC